MSGGTSYNGWPCSSNPAEINVQQFGDAQGFPFPGGVRAGDVATVLGYVATQLNNRVEPCVAGWDWGYEYRENVNDPGNLSCHASGTAIDWMAPLHPNGGDPYGGFNSEQVSTIYKILDEVQGAVQWGADYSGTKDPMHFEIIVDAQTLAAVAASLPSGGTDEDDNMDAQTFKQFMNDWYQHEPVVALNNGEQTTMEQFVKNLDQRSYTSERAAKQDLGES